MSVIIVWSVRSWKGTGATSRPDCWTRPTSASSRAGTWSISLSGRGFRSLSCGLFLAQVTSEWHRSGCPGEVRVGRLHIADMSPAEAEEFFVYQYLIVANTQKRVPGPAASTGTATDFTTIRTVMDSRTPSRLRTSQAVSQSR